MTEEMKLKLLDSRLREIETQADKIVGLLNEQRIKYDIARGGKILAKVMYITAVAQAARGYCNEKQIC